MIKTEIKRGKGASTKYPALYENIANVNLPAGQKNGAYVVLFTGLREGTVVAAEPGAYWELGHSAKDWVDCTNTAHWKPLKKGDSITLTQD